MGKGHNEQLSPAQERWEAERETRKVNKYFDKKEFWLRGKKARAVAWNEEFGKICARWQTGGLTGALVFLKPREYREAKANQQKHKNWEATAPKEAKGDELL